LTPLEAVGLAAAAAGAGVMNALAGGGTILTYPALLLVGESAIGANATSTVALLPGALASVFGYRREVAAHRSWLKTLLVPSLLGGAAGSALLLRTPEHAFAALAPWLILFATVLFMLQGAVQRGAAAGGAPAPGAARWAGATVAQLGVAVYGGYFGAGIGILMLAVLGFLGLRDIHAMNGVKNFFGACINAVAAGYFVWRGAVNAEASAVMIAGAIAGGYAGARFARWIGQERARRAVVVVGLATTALLLVQRWAR
jgi:uncharacterized membrane protein YfcA